MNNKVQELAGPMAQVGSCHSTPFSDHSALVFGCWAEVTGGRCVGSLYLGYQQLQYDEKDIDYTGTPLFELFQ